MSTRSCIGYVKENGDYVGCYCHSDGYPENILHELSKIPYKEVVLNVDRGIISGGIRELKNGFQYYNDRSTGWGYTYLPFNDQFDYIYVVKPNGDILCYDFYGKLLN